MRKIGCFIIIALVMIGLGYGQQSCVLDQIVRDLPSADVTGTHWFVYNVAADTDYTIESDPSNMTFLFSNSIFWSAEIGYNFYPPQPAVGDSLITLGSFDTAYYNNPSTYGDNLNHTGFYWLFSDILEDAATDHWADDTLRPMPKPDVFKTGPGGGANDTIWISIPNPRETRYSGQTAYDVLGYWIIADSTGTGTPNAFASGLAVAIDFIPVQGVYGENTEFYMLESDSFAPWDVYDVYFAYKIVARPDTTGGSVTKTPGYSTYHFSQNSDMIQVYQNVVGVEEQKAPRPKTELQYVFPNPFVQSAKIAYALATAAHVELKVYDVAGQLVQTVVNGTQSAGEHVVEFDGAVLPSGVYFYRLETSDKKFSGRLVKLE